MAIYSVNVKEISYGFVDVEADSVEDARTKVIEEYHNGNVAWASNDFQMLDVTKLPDKK